MWGNGYRLGTDFLQQKFTPNFWPVGEENALGLLCELVIFVTIVLIIFMVPRTLPNVSGCSSAGIEPRERLNAQCTDVTAVAVKYLKKHKNSPIILSLPGFISLPHAFFFSLAYIERRDKILATKKRQWQN